MTSNLGTNSSDTDSTGWSASTYNATASFVYSPSFTAPVLELLNAQQGERIIDFGCGSGEVTLEVKKQVGETGVVIGTDASESMVNKARSNGVDAFVSDLQALEFPVDFKGPVNGFDAVFTNATLHWCKRDPKGVLEGARKILKKGGRIVGEMGGFMNVIGVRSALHYVLKRRGHNPEQLDPWYFPSVEEYKELLTSASFRPTHVSLTPRITPLTEGGLTAWLHLFARHSFLKDMSDTEAAEVISDVERMCAVDCKDGKGNWAMVYTRLRFAAVLDD